MDHKSKFFKFFVYVFMAVLALTFAGPIVSTILADNQPTELPQAVFAIETLLAPKSVFAGKDDCPPGQRGNCLDIEHFNGQGESVWRNCMPEPAWNGHQKHHQQGEYDVNHGPCGDQATNTPVPPTPPPTNPPTATRTVPPISTPRPTATQKPPATDLPPQETEEVKDTPRRGCVDASALNFDAKAEVDDGSCEYPPAQYVCLQPDKEYLIWKDNLTIYLQQVEIAPEGGVISYPPVHVNIPLVGSGPDEEIWVTEDGCTVFFSFLLEGEKFTDLYSIPIFVGTPYQVTATNGLDELNVTGYKSELFFTHKSADSAFVESTNLVGDNARMVAPDCVNPAVSSDGNGLFCTNPINQLVAVDLVDNQDLTTTYGGASPIWRPDSSGIVYSVGSKFFEMTFGGYEPLEFQTASTIAFRPTGVWFAAVNDGLLYASQIESGTNLKVIGQKQNLLDDAVTGQYGLDNAQLLWWSASRIEADMAPFGEFLSALTAAKTSENVIEVQTVLNASPTYTPTAAPAALVSHDSAAEDAWVPLGNPHQPTPTQTLGLDLGIWTIPLIALIVVMVGVWARRRQIQSR